MEQCSQLWKCRHTYVHFIFTNKCFILQMCTMCVHVCVSTCAGANSMASGIGPRLPPCLRQGSYCLSLCVYIRYRCCSIRSAFHGFWGLTLRSLCLQGKSSIHWAIFLAPKQHFLQLKNIQIWGIIVLFICILKTCPSSISKSETGDICISVVEHLPSSL